MAAGRGDGSALLDDSWRVMEEPILAAIGHPSPELEVEG
jgi:hypothetical protein